MAIKHLGNFFLKAFFISIFIVAFLSLVTYFADEGLKRSNLLLYNEWNNLYRSETQADVLIQGSSHARVQISPHILDSILHTDSYNTGIDGYMFDMHYARNNIYMQHHRLPSCIIQTIDFETLGKSQTPFMSEQFIPYLGDTCLSPILEHTVFPKFYFLFPFLKYVMHNQLAARGVEEYFNVKRGVPSTSYKGYHAVDENWNNDFEKFRATNAILQPELDSSVIKLFDYFLDDCKKKNIDVILVQCPQYYLFTNRIQHLDKLNAVCEAFSKKYDCSVLDYTKDSMCYDLKYFNNGSHLNKTGSELFSVKLANDIKSIKGHSMEEINR